LEAHREKIILDVNCENRDPASGREVLLPAARRVDTFGGVVTSSLNPSWRSECPARTVADSLLVLRPLTGAAVL